MHRYFSYWSWVSCFLCHCIIIYHSICSLSTLYTLHVHTYYRVSHKSDFTLFLLIFRVLEHVQRNFWPVFNSPGNLLHDSHKNFENWFKNSWDNWGQSWHPSFRNWHFAITKSKKNNLVLHVPTLTSIISAIFLNQFSKFLWL